MRCDAGRGAMEKLVAPGSAVAANDVNFAIGPSDRDGQIMEQVEDPLIQLEDRTRAVIP